MMRMGTELFKVGKKMLLSVITIFLVWSLYMLNVNKTNSTEDFVKRWLTNHNGTLSTYVNESAVQDADLVSGREALSESLGFMMQYAIEREDLNLFKKQYSILTRYFMNDEGFIHWKTIENGTPNVTTNATVDDLRIIKCLIDAYELWGNQEFVNAGEKIYLQMELNTKVKNLLADYYDYQTNSKSDTVTIAYIDTEALAKIDEYGFSDEKVFQEMMRVLSNTPSRYGFFAKAYNVEQESYFFDNEVNMIDQLLIAINRSKIGQQNEEFLGLLKKKFIRDGKIFGRYFRGSSEPAVTYESPALYALAILLLLENGDHDFALSLYNRMIKFKEENPLSRHYGGYSVNKDNDTHIFDNLLPMLAESVLRNQGLVK
ncbi:glycosyl hydrolase family 8 [Mesobacillus selenatarsenatis]|nr:glycosyl hydrolase family 8 [Mesobacillus selenatarsenatis]